MKLQATLAILGLLLVASRAQLLLPNVTLPACDSPEAQAAAQVALDFINAQHSHGYKYTLNQIEDIKISTKGDGTAIYLLDLEFLETKCHVLDPTPAAHCAVRLKSETAVEADCDVALSKAAGVVSVVAFKCKTETETADLCTGCPYLIPFNHTEGIQLLHASLDIFNRNNSLNATFSLLEVGRLSSQVVGGGPRLKAEYAIIETNCTTPDDGVCVPLSHTVARHGFCLSESVGLSTAVECNIFITLPPLVDLNANVSALPPPPPVLLHAHTAGPGYTPTIHALKHHKVTAVHDPTASGLLSAESAESAEAPVLIAEVPAVPIVKRQVAEEAAAVAQPPEAPVAPVAVGQPLLPRCPAKPIHF